MAYSIKPTQIVYVCIILAVVNNVRQAVGSPDWQQECGPCKCTWNSGKKTADCKNTSLKRVPTKMSSDLQVLDLSMNEISEVKNDEFFDASLQNLHKIFMRNCTMLEISRDALKGLTIMIELDISFNEVKVLHPGTFSGLIKLRTLILNNNEISALEDNLFKDLAFLHKIELKNNKIKRIGLNTFVKLPTLTQIYLESNQLSVLKRDSFENLEKLTSLSLGSNPWNCTCELQQFRDFAIQKNLYTPPTNCDSPLPLRGKLWTDVPSDNFACRPTILDPSSSGETMDAMGENVTLTCRTKGVPKPDISWLYNKRPINKYDTRINIRESVETHRRNALDSYTSELIISGVRIGDHGSYVCVARNRGGEDEVELRLVVPTVTSPPNGTDAPEEPPKNDFLLLVCIIASVLLGLLILTLLAICCYCRRLKRYEKNNSVIDSGLVSSKMNKSQGDSLLEGSVIMEMQKSLLTEVNPVEKPPRRTDIESNGDAVDDGHELKKTLLDETMIGNHDDETQSVALSDTTARSRSTFVDDGYGTNLPPDLIAFPTRFPQSPSQQSSMSNIQEGRLYMRSPLSSPIYQHQPGVGAISISGMPSTGGIYTTTPVPPPAAFRTLQHPKAARALSVASRSNSPFTPAPIICSPVVMKQGYVTIPRRPRIPSWTPSVSSAMTDLPPTSPTSGYSGEVVEPVYDNLGLRTTAGGNSTLTLNKVGQVPPQQTPTSVKYTMKDRPLPATPMAYEPIQETAPLVTSPMNSDTEYLYNGNQQQQQQPTIVPVGGSGPTQQSNGGEKLTKIPPRPPPKPKKKPSVSSAASQGSSTKLFEDECEDGTEV